MQNLGGGLLINLPKDIRNSLANTTEFAISHLPKTGGSTLTSLLQRKDQKDFNVLFFKGLERCTCSSFYSCIHHTWQFKNEESNKSIIKFAHTSFNWNQSFLKDLELEQDFKHIFLYRPIEDRIISMMSDYVSQILMLDVSSVQNLSRIDALQRRERINYSLDGLNYFTLDEKFDSLHFLETFAIHGSGNVFFIRDYMNKNSDLFSKLLEHNKLQIINTYMLDAEIPKIFNITNFSRKRVSHVRAKDIINIELIIQSDIYKSLVSYDDTFEIIMKGLLR